MSGTTALTTFARCALDGMTPEVDPSPATRDIDAALVAHATAAPDAVALVDAERTLTYAALADEVACAAYALAARGLSAGERVAIVADKRVETVIALLGAMRLEAVGIPINPQLKPDQVRQILADSGARVLIASRRTLASLEVDLENSCPDLEHHLPTEDGFRVAPPEAATPPVSALAPSSTPNAEKRPGQHDTTDNQISSDASALILYTSGSTAHPKGVILTRSNLAHGAASVAAYLDIGPSDRLLALMPLSFDYGLNQVLTALATGARAVLFDYLLPKGVISAVVRHEITGLPAVPHLWNQLARLDWPPVPHLRYVTNTGGRMPVETTRLLEQKLPHTRIVLMYGFTEAFRSTWLPPAELARRPDSIGRAVPYATVLVVGENGRECAVGEVGELIHGGPLVAAGYWNAEAATRAKFRPRFAVDVRDDASDAIADDVATRTAERFAWSGDLARRDADGFLYFVSRREDLVKLHGYRVNPAEIEEAIGRSPCVHGVSVVCVPHPTLGQAAIAVLVTDEGDEDLSAVERHVREALPRFMRPERLIRVDTLPANPNGKVDRVALRTRYADLFEGDAA